MFKRRQQFANQQALKEFLSPPVSRLLTVILMSLAPVLSSAQDRLCHRSEIVLRCSTTAHTHDR